MDDLLASIFGLLRADSELIAMFLAEGLNYVPARSSQGEEMPVYPEFVVTAREGYGQVQGEAGEQFTTGHLAISTYIRDTESPKSDQMWLISKRAAKLVTGDRKAGIPGILGMTLTDAQNVPTYKVTVCRSVEPTGPMPHPDPKVRKHVSTYRVQLYALS